MIRPDQIPDEVVAAARDAWLMSDVNAKEDWRSAIAAAINTWPGGEIVDKAEGDDVALLLPLPQEVGDA